MSKHIRKPQLVYICKLSAPVQEMEQTLLLSSFLSPWSNVRTNIDLSPSPLSTSLHVQWIWKFLTSPSCCYHLALCPFFPFGGKGLLPLAYFSIFTKTYSFPWTPLFATVLSPCHGGVLICLLVEVAVYLYFSCWWVILASCDVITFIPKTYGFVS